MTGSPGCRTSWRGRQICLYHSDSDWNPADGMFGVIERLAAWYRRAAAGRLVEAGQPLHPPLAYPRVRRRRLRGHPPRSAPRFRAVERGHGPPLPRAGRRRGVAARRRHSTSTTRPPSTG